MEKRKMEALSLLSSSSFSVLQRFNKKQFRVYSSQNDLGSRKFYQKKSVTGKYGNVNVATLIRMLGEKKMPDVAQKLVFEMRSEGCLPNPDTLSALMICYAENGLISDAQAVWDEIINSSFLPTVKVLSDLMDAYGQWGCFDEVARITREVTLRKLDLCPQVYLLAISCFGEGGQLEMMETMMKEMVSSGFKVDSATGNAFVIYYTRFGSITEMETAYGRLKRSGILLEKEGIRAMASAYIKKKKFYQLGEFLRDVGLGRRNEGNLLWNLLLLSYAANFKMKSMQREFLKMVEAGFSPDLTTFNIRALAFSRMSLFWDLHVSLEHMKHEKVVPDLVTYGCVVDTFMDRKLGRNLNFALSKMNIDGSPLVSTDPLVFEVLGKGDFHSSSELLLESKRREEWTYKKLVAVYLKKKLINCWTMVLLIHLSYLHGPERELFIPFVGSFLWLTRLQLSGFVLSEMNFEIVDAIE